MRNKILLIMILGLALTYVGCTSGRTMVMNLPTERPKVSTLDVLEDQPTVSVPAEVTNLFREKLEAALFVGEEGSAPPFAKGKELILKYRFIQFNAGSQFKRWLAGGIGGYGEGSMTVEARFVNSSGKDISKVQSEGKIGAGFFGGSIDGAIEKCVEEVAQYAKQTFRKEKKKKQKEELEQDLSGGVTELPPILR